MTRIGIIKLKTPQGCDASIAVDIVDGNVDMHFMRTTDGETLVRLPPKVALKLADFLIKASKS